MTIRELCILFIISSYSNSANSQTTVYHPFPSSGGVWNQYLEYYCSSGGYAREYYSCVMAGDTVFNSKTYHKIIIAGLSSEVDSDCFFYPPVPEYGFIREDTINKMVYTV